MNNDENLDSKLEDLNKEERLLDFNEIINFTSNLFKEEKEKMQKEEDKTIKSINTESIDSILKMAKLFMDNSTKTVDKKEVINEDGIENTIEQQLIEKLENISQEINDIKKKLDELEQKHNKLSNKFSNHISDFY